MVSPLPHHISIVSRLFILFSLLLFSLSSPISTPLLSAHAFLLKRNLDSLNPPSDPSSSSPSLSIFSSLSLPSSPRENTHVSIPHIRPSLPLQTLPLLLLLKKRSSPLRSSSSSSRRLLPLLYLSPSSLLSSLRLRSSSPQCGKNDGEEISLQARRRKGGGGEILASSSSACVRDFFSSLGSRDFPSPVYRQRKTISLSHIRGKLALFFHQFVSTSFLFPSSYSLLSSHHPSFYPHSLSSSLSSSSLPSSSPPSSSSPSSISSPSSPPSSLSSSPPPPSPLPSSPPSSLPSSPPSSLPSSSSLSLETLPVSPSSASCVSSLLSLPQTNLLLLVSYDGSHFSGWTSNLSIKERCLLLYPTLLKKLQTNSSSHYKFFAPSSSSSAETERSLQASHRSAYKRTTCLPSSSSLQHDDRSAAYNSSVPSSSSVFCLKSVNSKKEKERMKKRGKGGQDEEQGEEERRGISKIRTVEGVLREAFAMIHPLSRKRQRDLSLQLFSCSSSFGQSEETESHSIDEKERLHALEKKKEKERDREVGIAEGEKERRTEREGEEEIEGHGQEGIDREMKNEERVKTRERRRRRRSERGRQEGGGGEEEREKDSLREIEDDEFYHDFLDRRKREYESLVQAVKQAEEEEEEEEGDLLHLPETKTKKKKPLIAPPIILRPASRTDRGVHALGSVCQYVSYHHALEISLESFVTAANHRLPPDVRILAAIDLNELAKHKEGREFFETFHRNEDKQTKKEKKGEISGVREEEEERGSVNGVEETQEKVVDAKEEEEAKNEVEKKKREEGRYRKETSTVNDTDDLKEEEEKKKKIAKNEGDNSTEEIQSRETHFSPYHSFSSSSPSSPSSSSRSSSSSFGHSDRGLDVMPTIYRLVRGKHYTYFLSFAETDHPLLRHYTWSIPRDPRIRNMALYERNTSPQKRERRRRGSDEVQEESVDEGREEGRNDERERKIQRKEAYRDMTRWRRERDVDTKEASLSLDLEREKKEEDEEEREKDRRRNAWSSSAAFSVKDEGWNLYRDVFSFDLENMRKAAELMTGSHSFKAFRCEYKGKEREKRRRKGEEESICHMEQLAITPLRFMPWPESILGDDEERCRHLPYLPSLSSSSFFSSSSSSETQPFHPSPRSSSRVFSPGVAEAVFSLSPGSSSSSSSSFLPKKKVEEEEERDGDPSSAKRSSSSHLPQGLRIDVVGNRFLYKMIRKMVGGLVQVGLGRLSLEDIRHALIHGKLPPVPPSSCVKEKDDKEEETEARVRSRRRRDEGILCAPARGLVLQRVFLPSFLERLFYQ